MCSKIEARVGEEVGKMSCSGARGGSLHIIGDFTLHFHFVVETSDANLSQGMRQLNGIYTQHFNRRHGLGGHLFQGSFKGILVERDPYLLALSRYVVLNPVRAGMVRMPRHGHGTATVRWSA